MVSVTKFSFAGAHGAQLSALRASPAPGAAPLGSVIVIQEIFGLTTHIAQVCGGFADAGYETLAPGLFDRVEKDFLAEIDPEGMKRGLAAVQATPWAQVAGDLQAAIALLPQPCFVAGFCWGGSASWIAAARCEGVKAVSCFYGRLIADLLDDKPKVPVMLHYGARDPGIPHENIERVRAASPGSPLYLYDAGHGFCRAGSPDFNGEAAALAVERTLNWFARWRV